jgi:hypothetical protein
MRRQRRRIMNAFTLQKILGGGNFSGSNCDFSPLRLDDKIVKDYDNNGTIPIYRSLNIEENQCIEKAEGNFNQVCSVNCKESPTGAQRNALFRKSIVPIAENEVAKEFQQYHSEMKLQIELSEKGLSPNVYMYGVLAIATQPTNAVPPKPPATTPSAIPSPTNNENMPPAPARNVMDDQPNFMEATNKRKLSHIQNAKENEELADEQPIASASRRESFQIFSIMELKRDFFVAFSQYVDRFWRVPESSREGLVLNKQLTELVLASIKLITELGETNRIYFDIKIENMVFDIRDKKDPREDEYCKKAYLIDCDNRFVIPETVIRRAILTVIPDAPQPVVQDYVATFCRRIMRYIFSSKLLTLIQTAYAGNTEALEAIMDTDWYQYLQRFAELRTFTEEYKNNPPRTIPVLPKEAFSKIIGLEEPNRTFASMHITRPRPYTGLGDATQPTEATVPFCVHGCKIPAIEARQRYETAIAEKKFTEAQKYEQSVDLLTLKDVIKTIATDFDCYDDVPDGTEMMFLFFKNLCINANWFQHHFILYCFLDLPLSEAFYNVRDLVERKLG